MSVDKRLEYELSRNISHEEELVKKLEADSRLQLQLFQTQQAQIDSQSQTSADLSQHYLARDDAFFKYLHILQQLRSNVKFVTDFHQPVTMPKIQASDARIYSAVDKHDPQKSEYLADFEEFIRDKKAHESEIEKINQWIINVDADIRAIMLPQILYFLLVWLPPLIYIYRYFAPVNPLDQAIKQAQALESELSDLEQKINSENEGFYIRWNEKYPEYSALSMNEKKLKQLRTEQKQYEQMLDSKQILEAFVQHCEEPEIQQALQNVITQPNYINLFHACALLCEKKINDGKSTPQIDQVLKAMGHLYPEVQGELNQFTQHTLFNLQARSIFDSIKDKYQRLIEISRKTLDNVNRARKRMKDIAIHSSSLSSLNLIFDAQLMYNYNEEMKKLRTYIEKSVAELGRRRNMITPFDQFLNNRTGESLINLYQFLSASTNAESNSFAETLKQLYPAALKTLETEKHGNISIQTRYISRLQNQYLQKINLIKKSPDPQMQPLKEVAAALYPLLTTPDWKWSHFTTIEQHIRKNPQYARNPTLAGLFNKATQLVAASQQFQPPVIKQSPASQAPELILNQANPLPTFFQPPSRISAAANALIKDIMGKIKTIDQTLSSEKKQATIEAISDDMVRYIDMLSSEDAIQTISPQHLQLLSEMSAFIRQVTTPALQIHLNEENIEHKSKQLLKLDPEHPIRKGVEFLITLFRSKNEYMAVDTRYARTQLDKDIRIELQQCDQRKSRHQEKLSRRKKLRADTLSLAAWMELHQWTIAHGMKNIINGYVTNLKQFPSPHNAEESREIQAVATLIDQLYSTIRYERSKYGEIPQLLRQLEQQCAALEEHPIHEAVIHLLSALKETKEYAAVPGAEVRELRAKK